MAKKTPLYEEHIAAGAKMVDFHGWELPIHYGSQIEEHHTVRQAAGMFDVSHMTVVDVLGPGTRDFLRYLLANDVDKIKSRGQALYTCMLNNHGGVIDDLIVYFIDVNHYRVVLNAATRDKDLAWMNKQANGFSVGLHERDDLAMVAVQGPKVFAKIVEALDAKARDALLALKPFGCVSVGNLFFARTGYTGEDGFEAIIPNNKVAAFWRSLLAVGIKPCGLGARDTLRLEAGLNLYGADMDETTSPLVSNLTWTVAWEPQDRLFVGRTGLEMQKREGVEQKLVGLLLKQKGILRNGQKVIVEGVGEGVITSGGFSPTLNCSIAFARVPVATGESCFVEIRGKQLPVQVVKPTFVRRGESMLPKENA